MKTLRRLWEAIDKAILSLAGILAVYFVIYALSPRAGFVITFAFMAAVLWVDGVRSPDWVQIIPVGPFLAIALYVAGLPIQAVLLITVLVVGVGFVWSFFSWFSKEVS